MGSPDTATTPWTGGTPGCCWPQALRPATTATSSWCPRPPAMWGSGTEVGWGQTRPRVMVATVRRQLGARAGLLFIVGTSSPQLDRAIAQEAGEQGDMLQYSIEDTYRNLVYKPLMAFIWINKYGTA